MSRTEKVCGGNDPDVAGTTPTCGGNDPDLLHHASRMGADDLDYEASLGPIGRRALNDSGGRATTRPDQLEGAR